ncbi:class I SAM-dependent methyltransferase [Marinomonas sp. C2222]|uniref:Class I SAM-dependent methyltransferase n=1 Tax=Marinomonas sargassi TaxID=2984494 RepID=A0ABT2YW17_9GAMM|nr:class I SAM-dependent methyltransferase [Marinomonas sargassi]MCV2404085.1 class I SAM-dependent methyltransferase [Marinomonas sargassi]
MKSTERFSDRADNYLKYRPSYPLELIEVLMTECGLDRNSVIADIGSGTGKLSELLLDKDLCVYGVEPNKEMRTAAEQLLVGHPKFTSVQGDSSHTGLEEKTVNLVIAAQAFHWFDKEPTKIEFQRILRPRGRVGLVWNERDLSTPFQKEYDLLLEEYCDGYTELNHRNVSEQEIKAFLDPASYQIFTFPYEQLFDKAGFLGRMYSSSYTPQQGSNAAKNLNAAAEVLFHKYEKDGVVAFSYLTKLYLSGSY